MRMEGKEAIKMDLGQVLSKQKIPQRRLRDFFDN
jgi:hypothetical protein